MAWHARRLSPRSRALSSSRQVEGQSQLQLTLRGRGKRRLSTARSIRPDDHLVGTPKHLSGVVVRDRRTGIVVRHPAAGRDPFRVLWVRRGLARFHEVEVTNLVNELAPESEIPVDRLDASAEREVIDARLLAHFAHRGVLGALARLEVALGEPPVLITVPDEQEQRASLVEAIHDPAGRRLSLGA